MADSRTLQIVINAKNNAEGAFKKLGSDLNSLTSSFGLGHLSILAVASAVGALGVSMIKAAGEFEQTKVAFTTMLGSAEQANTLLRDIANFAMNTPFEIKDLEKNSKLLLAYGVAAADLLPTLKMLGDTAAGVSVPIEQIARAYGQVKVAGRLMGQELLQFINAGVPLIKELSNNLGVSESKIKKMVEDGKIGFKDVENAFRSLTSEGGKFNDMMENQSRTLLGRISNLKDKWNVFLREQGSGLLMFANMAVDKLAQILDWLVKDAEGFNWVGKTIYGLGQFFIALGKTVDAIIKTFVGFGASIIDTAKLLYAFVKDGINNFLNFGKILQNVFKALGQALTGNFEEAGDTIKSTLQTALQNTIAEFNNFSTNQDATTKFVADAWEGVSKAWKNFATLDGFSSAQEKFGTLGTDIKSLLGGAIDDTDGKAKKLTDSFEKYKDKIIDFKDKMAEAFSGVTDKIDEINGKMEELLVGKAKDDLGWNESIAQAYVDQEKKVSDIKSQWQSEDDQERKNALFQDLQREQLALDQKKSIELAYQNEVAEARRRASLTDFNRLLEDLEKKKIILDQEFEDKRVKLENELKIELQKLAKLKEINDVALKEQDKFLAQSEKLTADSVNREIEKYNQLAKAISAAKSGRTSGFVSVGSDVNNRANQAIPNVNITITGNTLLDSQAAEKMGDMIVNKLGLTTKLSY